MNMQANYLKLYAENVNVQKPDLERFNATNLMKVFQAMVDMDRGRYYEKESN